MSPAATWIGPQWRMHVQRPAGRRLLIVVRPCRLSMSVRSSSSSRRLSSNAPRCRHRRSLPPRSTNAKKHIIAGLMCICCPFKPWCFLHPYSYYAAAARLNKCAASVGLIERFANYLTPTTSCMYYRMHVRSSSGRAPCVAQSRRAPNDRLSGLSGGRRLHHPARRA